MIKGYLLFLTLFFLLPTTASGQSDLFEIRTPNVLIIFDTSSSMNMDVYGNAVPPGTAKGVDGKNYDFEGGGNHPKSKLYIAKEALQGVIKNLENVNLGFATYAQRKEEKYRARYKKYVMTQSYQPEKTWCDKRYYRWTTTNDTSPRYANSFSSDSFKDAWGIEHKSVKKGEYVFKRKVMIHDKDIYLHPPRVGGSFQATKEYTIEYKVTDIKYNAEYNYYVYKYEVTSPAYDLYQETTRRIEGCGSCASDTENNPFSREWGGPPKWKTYFPGESEYDNPSNGRTKKWWDCTTGSSPEVKEKWDWKEEWRTYKGSLKNCDKTQSDGWEYVGDCHDVSEYYYPIGPSSPALPHHKVDRPHTWSYFNIISNTWSESVQPKPFYPAPAGEPGQNPNNFFFINFPKIDDSTTGYQTRNKIVSLLDLTPVQNPETKRWHTKLPLKPGSITSNTIESLYTPLADTLYQARRYFEDYIKEDPPSQSNCRGNYIILFTDGLESARFKEGSTEEPDYDAAANEARELFNLVKDKFGKPAGVKTYVIGFGKGLGDKPHVLDNIAKNGGTSYIDKKTGETKYAFFADDLKGLQEAFKEIFRAIGTGYSRSNPVVSRERNRLYRGYFNLPGWEGHLVAFALGPDGNITDKNGDKKIDEKDALWDAGYAKDMDKSARIKVYTWEKDNNPDLIEFKEASAGKLKDLLNPDKQDINQDGKEDIEDTKTIIRFILNPGCDGGLYKGTRSPTWSLGDIYHSTPLVVGSPPFNFPDKLFPQKYSDFKKKYKNRETTIYVGVNDGMLHAFDKDGKERYAIIPKNLLGKLRKLKDSYQFFVDSSPRAYDVYFSKGKKKGEWRTVLVSGLRGGGNYYFALDVTDPDDPDVLWEITDPGLGATWSRPEIGRVRIGGKEKFIAFVGGGYSDPLNSENDNIGNTFYVLDIEDDGKILKKFTVGNKTNKIPSGATAFDRDLDGRIDAVYFGDIQGTLWKIKIDGEEDVDKWKLIELFKSDGGNPIFYPPAVTKNNQGKVLVYFGQGDETNIFENTKIHYFYEIWDKGESGEKLWRTELKPGEKVLAAPTIANNVVYFTTWEYTGIQENCGAGIGRLYGLTSTRASGGGGLAALYYDISGVRKDKPQEYITIGVGIPSAPIVKPGRIYVSSSIIANNVIVIPIPPWGRGKLKSWREVF